MTNNNITYRQVGDYMIPNLTLPPEEANITLGKWGMLHKDFVLKNKPIEVNIMTAKGRFWKYLAEIDKQATEMFDLLVEQMRAADGVTEQLKSGNSTVWVQKMNNIQSRAREVVCKELIYV